jgi:3-hydroxy-9,10-secoandrosta-1,3,5(10)-triene-9,17-dione monooxygenase reductase component
MDEVTSAVRMPGSRLAAQLDSRYMRDVLGHAPTSVAVVCGIDETGNPVGMVVGTFVSVSLDPPLVAYLPSLLSTTFPRLRGAEGFTVNLLGADQHDLCRRFAASGGDKFHGVAWRASPVSGAPLLDGTVAWVDCLTEEVRAVGDHYLVLGRVVALDHDDSAGSALVFHRGSLSSSHPPPPTAAALSQNSGARSAANRRSE